MLHILFFLILPAMFYFTHEEYLQRRRNFYSAKWSPSDDIVYKLRHMGLLNPATVSYFLKRPPEHECNVTFSNGKVLKTAHIVTSEDLAWPPNVTWPTQENHFYTLYIGDLDSKIGIESNDSDFTHFQAKCHWLVGNIRGCDVQRGKPLFRYKFPGKVPSRELRRFLILVYDQHHPEPLDFDGGFNIEREDRQDFRIDKFAEFYNFEHPYAANLYLLLDNEQYD